MVTGTLYAAGTLNVELINGYMPYQMETFDILDWTVLGTNRFSTINLPSIGNRAWVTNALYITGQITAVFPGGTIFIAR